MFKSDLNWHKTSSYSYLILLKVIASSFYDIAQQQLGPASPYLAAKLGDKIKAYPEGD